MKVTPFCLATYPYRATARRARKAVCGSPNALSSNDCRGPRPVVSYRRRSAAGEVHAERRAAARTVFDPRSTTVELGEALHEGQADPHPR
jgi:hypothetical protein